MNEQRPNWFVSAFRFVGALTGLRGRSVRDQSEPAAAAEENDEAEHATVASADIVAEPEIRTAEVTSEIRTDTGTPLPEQQERDHRRDLVRKLFNDFWTGIDEKPVTFAERLDAAVPYINMALTERDLGWQLDAATRKQLGLPVSPADRD
jgi:hypothetical protein